MNNLQILWVGSMEDDKEIEKMVEKGYNAVSAQVSQKNLFIGLENASGTAFDSINGSALNPYPLYEDFKINPMRWQGERNEKNVRVGFLNLKYANRLLCKHAMVKEAKRWLNSQYERNKLIVFAYSMCSASMATACLIKRKVPNAKIFLIVPDLPQFMDLGQSLIKKLLKKIDWQLIKRQQKKFNGFVLYAEKMAEFLKISNDKWMRMEGSYNLLEDAKNVDKVIRKKAAFYSGTLSMQYGIGTLLDVFMQIKDTDAELWLAGAGNAETYIANSIQKDSRIHYFGLLQRDEVLILQKQASVLVNMRLPSHPVANYSFPSKIFEYMASGTPVISFELGGIPTEYFPYLLVVRTIEEFKAMLIKTLRMGDSERNAVGNQARAFIVETKTAEIQCTRIWRFVLQLCE